MSITTNLENSYFSEQTDSMPCEKSQKARFFQSNEVANYIQSTAAPASTNHKISTLFNSHPFTHSDLIETAKALGYSFYSENDQQNDGACEGISYTGMFAGLSGNIDAFQNRLDALGKLSQEYIGPPENRIETIAKTILENKNFERKFDLLPFFEQVCLLQQPEEYSDLFEEGSEAIYQRDPNNIESLLKITVCNALSDAGGIQRLTHWSGVYSLDELVSYLTQIQDLCKNTTTNNGLGILLASCNHTITLVYDKEKGEWIFIDINQLPIKKSTDPQTIAQYTIKSFQSNDSIPSVDNYILHSDFYALKESSSIFMNALTEWKENPEFIKLHKATQERVNKLDSSGYIWLNHAVSHGSVNQVRELLECGSNPNHINEHGEHLLKIAMLRYVDDPSIMETLLNHGSNPNGLHAERTPLYVAACIGDLNCTCLLLQNKADPNLECKKDKVTPLYIAAKNNRTRIAEILLECGADPMKGSYEDKKTPLYIAAKKGNVDLIKILLKHKADPNLGPRNGKTPLYVAAKYGHIDAVQLLLNNNADPNLGDFQHKSTPLAAAIEHGQTEVITLLLKFGAKTYYPSIRIN